jgi:hypothetical protein
MFKETLCFFICICPSVTQAQHRHHDSHVHGAGSMNIALDGQELTVELAIPGSDILGFEHVAKSESEKGKVEAALRILNDASKMFSFVPVSACSLKGTPNIKFVSEGEEDDSHDDHESHHEDDNEDTNHTELKAEYIFDCKSVKGVKFEGFNQFSSLKELDAQVAFDNVQVRYELSPKEPTAYLEDRD